MFNDVGKQWFGPKVIGDYDLQRMFLTQDMPLVPLNMSSASGEYVTDLAAVNGYTSTLTATCHTSAVRDYVPMMTRRVVAASQLLPPDTNIGATGEQRRRAAMYCTTADTAPITAPWTNVNQLSMGPLLHILRNKGGRNGSDAVVTLRFSKVGLNTFLRHRTGRQVVPDEAGVEMESMAHVLWSSVAAGDPGTQISDTHFVTRFVHFTSNGENITAASDIYSGVCLICVDEPDLVYTRVVQENYNWTAATSTATMLAYVGYWRAVLSPWEFALAFAMWAQTAHPNGTFAQQPGFKLTTPMYHFPAHLATYIWEAPVLTNANLSSLDRLLGIMKRFHSMSVQRRLHARGGLIALGGVGLVPRRAFWRRTQNPSGTNFMLCTGMVPVDGNYLSFDNYVASTVTTTPWEVFAALGVDIVVSDPASFKPVVVDTGLASEMVLAPATRVTGGYYSPSFYASAVEGPPWYRLERAIEGADQTASFEVGPNTVVGLTYFLINYDADGYVTATNTPSARRPDNHISTQRVSAAPALAFGKPVATAFLL